MNGRVGQSVHLPGNRGFAGFLERIEREPNVRVLYLGRDWANSSQSTGQPGEGSASQVALTKSERPEKALSSDKLFHALLSAASERRSRLYTNGLLKSDYNERCP